MPSGAPTVVRAVAVAQTSTGLVGSVANVSISQEAGSGLLFLDTQPFSQVDLQGSARLAVRVAGAVTGINVAHRDFYVVVRSESRVIGGPSAGGVLAVGAIAALKGWEINPRVYMTGTINPDGSIGPVGGVPEKARAAAERGGTLFLFPVGLERAFAYTAQGRVLVNVTQYCAEELSIECRPVAEIEAAVTVLTGYEFERPPLPTDASSPRFNAVMLPLASQELQRANESTRQAEQKYAELGKSLQSFQVEERLNEARQALAEGDAAFGAGHYYTASSKAFNALINARYVHTAVELADLTTSSERDAYAGARIQEADDALDDAGARARSATIRGLSQLQAVGAAQLRVTQGENNLDRARSGYRSNDAVQMLFYAAFALQRASTVGWWLEIGTDFAQGELLLLEEQTRKAKEVLDESEELLTYVASVLEGSDTGSSILQDEMAQLDEARLDLHRGRPAAAIFEALEAQVRAGIALETAAYGTAVPAARLRSAADSALRAVAEARAAGIEPVLAASNLEFAGDQKDAVDQLTFYDFARIVARSSDYFLQNDPDRETPSRFVGSGPSLDALPGPLASTEVVALVAASFLLGAAVAALLVLGTRATIRAPTPSLRAPPTLGSISTPAIPPVVPRPRPRSPTPRTAGRARRAPPKTRRAPRAPRRGRQD